MRGKSGCPWFGFTQHGRCVVRNGEKLDGCVQNQLGLWLVTRVVASLFAALIGTLLFAILVFATGDVMGEGEAFLTLLAMTWICLRIWAAILEPGQTERWKGAIPLIVLFPGALTALPFYLVIRLCCTDRVVRWMGATRSSDAWKQRIPAREATVLIVALLAFVAGMVGFGIWGHQAFVITACCAMVLVFIWLLVRLI